MGPSLALEPCDEVNSQLSNAPGGLIRSYGCQFGYHQVIIFFAASSRSSFTGCAGGSAPPKVFRNVIMRVHCLYDNNVERSSELRDCIGNWLGANNCTGFATFNK